MLRQNAIPAIVALVVGMTAWTQPATAADIIRIETILPINVCQGALPSFEGAFRKRPRGIRNEGAASAFLSCALLSREASSLKHTSVAAKFVNTNATARNVNCTLVDGPGIGTSPPSVNLGKVVSVPANGSGFATWTAANNGGDNYYAPAISCEIPPGVEINLINDTYLEEIGN